MRRGGEVFVAVAPFAAAGDNHRIAVLDQIVKQLDKLVNVVVKG